MYAYSLVQSSDWEVDVAVTSRPTLSSDGLRERRPRGHETGGSWHGILTRRELNDASHREALIHSRDSGSRASVRGDLFSTWTSAEARSQIRSHQREYVAKHVPSCPTAGQVRPTLSNSQKEHSFASWPSHDPCFKGAVVTARLNKG